MMNDCGVDGTLVDRMKDLAPEITHQRLLIEGYYSVSVSLKTSLFPV